jgi:uncharacterized protein (DUF362 family)
MDRRMFISALTSSALVSGLMTVAWPVKANRLEGKQLPHLVQVSGNDPAKMALLAIDALGGIDRFVKPGYRVLLKPTMCFAAAPGEHMNSDPQVLVSVIRACQRAGAAHVYVLDHTVDDWKTVYKVSGLEKATKKTGNRILPANEHFLFENDLRCTTGHEIEIHKQLKECDVVINVCKAGFDKDGSMMNGFMNISGLLWKRGGDGNDEKENAIFELIKHCCPVLNIVEATTIVNKNNGQKLVFNKLIASTDLFSADAKLHSLLGYEPGEISYLCRAQLREAGRIDLNQIETEHIYL